MPVQPPPLQPVNVEPATGVAVSVTTVPWPTTSLQSAPHEMPAGDDVTVPVPVPASIAVSVYVLSVNVAVTLIAAVIETVQVPVPVQPPPDQPVNVEPEPAAAVSVTEVPLVYGSVQSAPQLMPAGDEVTVPAPVPALVTLSANGASAKSAVTVVAAVSVTTHEPVPVQPPPVQPLKIEPPAGVADSVIIVP